MLHLLYNICIRTVSSWFLLSVLLNWFRLVWVVQNAPYTQFQLTPARKELNVLKLKSSCELTVLIYILCTKKANWLMTNFSPTNPAPPSLKTFSICWVEKSVWKVRLPEIYQKSEKKLWKPPYLQERWFNHGTKSQDHFELYFFLTNTGSVIANCNFWINFDRYK